MSEFQGLDGRNRPDHLQISVDKSSSDREGVNDHELAKAVRLLQSKKFRLDYAFEPIAMIGAKSLKLK